MDALLKLLKRIWILNFFRRVFVATRQYNFRYGQILRWGFRSNEDTNYTYHLTPENITYLACTIAVVLKQDYETIAAYIEEANQDQALRKHIADMVQQSPFRKFADKEVRLARRLGWYVFVRMLKPKVVVETGVDKGLGAVLLCSALLKNKAEGFEGRYYGTDINPNAGYLLAGPYKAVGEILYGDSIESLSAFKQPIDLFINDSDHSMEYEYREYLTIQSKLSEQAVILGDNAEVSPSLVKFSIETGRQFLFFQERPADHWYPGGGIGISYKNR